jgi:hypothetical protein
MEMRIDRYREETIGDAISYIIFGCDHCGNILSALSSILKAQCLVNSCAL